MKFLPTYLSDILLIEPVVCSDERGFFFEIYNEYQFAKAGLTYSFVQDNYSGSCKGVLRGLHYQIQQPQGKLILVVSGEIFDVCVDLRRSSSTFGKWMGQSISADNRLMIWIPPGFAHGYYVISDWAEIAYKVTEFYAPQWERTLMWNDPAIGIKWPLHHDVPLLLSTKDATGYNLDQAEVFD